MNSTNNKTSIPQGIWPVMVTPLTEDLKINYPALKALIQWYESAGVHGLFANCLSSEMYELDENERLALTQAVVDQSIVPVLTTGTFYTDAHENAAFINKISETGVDGVVLITGLLAGEDEDDSVLEESIRVILAETGDIPLGLYECPVPYKRLLSPALIGKLAKENRFIYSKDTSCIAEVVVEKIEAAKDSPLAIYNAHTPDALDSIRNGGAGISPIGANFYPELYTYLWENGRDEDISDDLVAVEQFLVENDGIVHHKYPLSAKYFLQLRGLPMAVNTRKDVPELETADITEIEALYQRFLALCERVGIQQAVVVA